MSKMSNKPVMFYCQECGHPIEGDEESIDMVLNNDGELVCDACESYVNLATARQRDADVEATTELIELGKRKEHDMSKMKELDLRKQEAVDQCNEMRRENECGFSHVYHPYNKIVEYAFTQGFHAAGELVVRPMQENIEDEPEDKCITCDTPIVMGGDWGYCTPCFNKLSDEYVNRKTGE